jgi:hypothetical protein
MILVKLALLLKTALRAMERSDRNSVAEATRVGLRVRRLLGVCGHSKEQSFDVELLRILQDRLGETPEALNQLALLARCAEAAKSVQDAGEIMPAELIATTLGYFMLHTIGLQTFGLIYSGQSHPLLSLVEETPEPGLTIVDVNRKIIDSKMACSRDLELNRKRVSTAILIVNDAHDADTFREQILQPLTAGIAANGIDIMAVANTPELATVVTSAMQAGPRFHAVDFPSAASGLGLSGISLRCILST